MVDVASLSVQENQYEPKIISSLITKIRTVHCGAYHTCALAVGWN
jgi:hypothetical protein